MKTMEENFLKELLVGIVLLLAYYAAMWIVY